MTSNRRLRVRRRPSCSPATSAARRLQRSSGMLSFGLPRRAGRRVRVHSAIRRGRRLVQAWRTWPTTARPVDFGASFAVMAAAVVSPMFVGAVEILLAAGSLSRAARIVAPAGFAVQALAVVLFASTMQPYATTLMFALLRRRSSSATVFCARNPGRLRGHAPCRPCDASWLRRRGVVSLRFGPARDPHPGGKATVRWKQP